MGFGIEAADTPLQDIEEVCDGRFYKADSLANGSTGNSSVRMYE